MSERTLKEIERAKQKEAQWLDIQKAWFLPKESLGVMETIVAYLESPTKKERQAAMRRIVKVLSGLQLIPSKVHIVGAAAGCLSTGERGLFLFSSVTTQLRQADIPS